MQFSAARLRLVFLSSIALALAGCGGGHHQAPRAVHATTANPAAVLAQDCPRGQSYMGCSQAHASPAVHFQRLNHLQLTSPPTPGSSGRAEFPDVSSYQGPSIDWRQVKAWGASGGAIKAWEFRTDPDFFINAQNLHATGLPWSAYDFVRYCDASAFIGVLRSALSRGFGPLSPPVLDMEVPSSGGCAVTMANQIHAALNVWPYIYTAPGTWPGGSNGGLSLWVADYGPSSPPCFWYCLGDKRLVGWQFTDGQFGQVACIPTIGCGDVSHDYGFFAAVVPPKPPFNPQYQLYPDGPVSSTLGTLHERETVQRYDQLRRAPRTYAGQLRWLHTRIGALMWTVYHAAHRSSPPLWGTGLGYRNRIFRFDGLRSRYLGERLL